MIFARAMFDIGAAVEMRLQRYITGIGELLGNDSRRASFATYVMGLLSEGERKSVEPIAARACPDPKRIDAEHQRLLHFIAVADWQDRAIRRHAARYALAVMTAREKVQAWILDDTGFLKQGSHSVGVQRQYTGSRRQGDQLPGWCQPHGQHRDRTSAHRLRALPPGVVDL